MDLVDFSFLVQLKEIEIRYVDLTSMERLRVEKWVEKLMKVQQSGHERNEYVRLLLGMVAAKSLSYPFHVPPDPGPLPLPALPNRLHSKFKNIMGAHESVFWSGIYSELMPPEAYSYHELELHIESDKQVIKELQARVKVLEGTCDRIAEHCRDHREETEESDDLGLDVEQRNRLKWVEGTMEHYNAYKTLYEQLLLSVRQSTADKLGLPETLPLSGTADSKKKCARPTLSSNQCPPRKQPHPLQVESAKGPETSMVSAVTASKHHPTHDRPPIIFSPHHSYPNNASALATSVSEEKSGLDQDSVLEFVYKHKEAQVAELEDYVVAMENRHCEADRKLRDEISRQKDKYIEYIQCLQEKERDMDKRYLDAFGEMRRLQEENKSLRDTCAHNDIYIETLLGRINDLTKVTELISNDDKSMAHLEGLFMHSLEQICAASPPLQDVATARNSRRAPPTASSSARAQSTQNRKAATRPSTTTRNVGRAGQSSGWERRGRSTDGLPRKPPVPTRAERLVSRKRQEDYEDSRVAVGSERSQVDEKTTRPLAVSALSAPSTSRLSTSRGGIQQSSGGLMEPSSSPPRRPGDPLSSEIDDSAGGRKTRRPSLLSHASHDAIEAPPPPLTKGPGGKSGRNFSGSGGGVSGDELFATS